MEKKVIIEKNGVKITLEGYSAQEINDIITEEQKQVREVNLNDLINKQEQKPIKIIPLTTQEDFRHIVDIEEQAKRFRYNPIRVSDPVIPPYIITCFI